MLRCVLRWSTHSESREGSTSNEEAREGFLLSRVYDKNRMQRGIRTMTLPFTL
jgi:hypothetical protein